MPSDRATPYNKGYIIEEISGHVVQTVRCRSARHRTVVVHKLTKSIVRQTWFVIFRTATVQCHAAEHCTFVSCDQ